MGWDVFFTTQDPESVDKQILAATGEEFIHCVRKDYFRIPVVSDLYDIYRIFKTKGKERESKILPHLNEASYRRGKTKLFNKPYRSEIYRPVEFFGTYDTNQLFDIDTEHYRGRDVDMRATYSLLPGQTLRKYEIIRQMQLKEALNKQTEEANEMNVTLDEITLPKEKPPFPKWQLLFFLLFCYLAYSTLSFALSVDDSTSSTPQQSSQVHQVEVPIPAPLEPSVPDYLHGVYISGWVLIKRNGNYIYDYAFHDQYDNGFDYTAFGMELKPAAPCIAWLTTADGITAQVTCRKSLSQPKKQLTSSSTLGDFSLGKVASATIDSF